MEMLGRTPDHTACAAGSSISCLFLRSTRQLDPKGALNRPKEVPKGENMESIWRGKMDSGGAGGWLRTRLALSRQAWAWQVWQWQVGSRVEMLGVLGADGQATEAPC